MTTRPTEDGTGKYNPTHKQCLYQRRRVGYWSKKRRHYGTKRWDLSLYIVKADYQRQKSWKYGKLNKGKNATGTRYMACNLDDAGRRTLLRNMAKVRRNRYYGAFGHEPDKIYGTIHLESLIKNPGTYTLPEGQTLLMISTFIRLNGNRENTLVYRRQAVSCR